MNGCRYSFMVDAVEVWENGASVIVLSSGNVRELPWQVMYTECRRGERRLRFHQGRLCGAGSFLQKSQEPAVCCL